jgi:hypothetical protein
MQRENTDSKNNTIDAINFKRSENNFFIISIERLANVNKKLKAPFERN